MIESGDVRQNSYQWAHDVSKDVPTITRFKE